MAEVGHLVSGRSIKSTGSCHPTVRRSHNLLSFNSKTIAFSRKKDFSLVILSTLLYIFIFSISIEKWDLFVFNNCGACCLLWQTTKKGSKTPRRLITISTGDGRWHGKWNSQYLLSLQDLHLQDLIEDDEQKDADVSINLSVQKVIPTLYNLKLIIKKRKVNFFFLKW